MMNEWMKAEFSESTESVVPAAGESVVLYLCPHDRSRCWECDIGSLYMASEEEDTLIWGSAFGIHSGFDGVKFGDILKDYEVCFTAVPPLESGRFPAPLGISHGRRERIPRAAVKQILDRLI